MKPILFNFLGINVYGYGTMIAIGICIGGILLSYRAKRKGYDEDSILNMLIISVICGALGGKCLYIITQIKNITNNMATFKNPGVIKDSIVGGFVIYGAILGGALGAFFYSKEKGWNIFEIFDIMAPVVILAQGFGRIGCFLAGCCYGKETTLPIGVKFTNSLFAPSGIMRHPTQLYSSIFDFLLAFFLLWYDKKKRTDGQVFSLYVILYSLGRFLIEFLRDDPRGNVGSLSTSQFISIFILIFGVIIYNLDKFKNNYVKDV